MSAATSKRSPTMGLSGTLIHPPSNPTSPRLVRHGAAERRICWFVDHHPARLCGGRSKTSGRTCASASKASEIARVRPTWITSPIEPARVAGASRRWSCPKAILTAHPSLGQGFGAGLSRRSLHANLTIPVPQCGLLSMWIFTKDVSA